MKLLLSAAGNSGKFMDDRSEVLKQKSFRYIIVKTRDTNLGLIGGYFSYEFLGTDDFDELINPEVLRDVGEIIDTSAGKVLKKEEFIKQYVKSLTPVARAALIDEMLIEYLSK